MTQIKKKIILISSLVFIVVLISFLLRDKKSEKITVEDFIKDLKVTNTLTAGEILRCKFVPDEDPEDTYTKLYRIKAKKEDVLSFIQALQLKQEDNFYYPNIKEEFTKRGIDERFNPPNWWEPCEFGNNIYWNYFTDKKGILHERDSVHGYVAFQVCDEYTYVYIDNAWLKTVPGGYSYVLKPDSIDNTKFDTINKQGEISK